jgi:hypothetical protein
MVFCCAESRWRTMTKVILLVYNCWYFSIFSKEESMLQ